MKSIHFIFSLFFILSGIVLLLFHIRCHKKGKFLVMPWRKALWGYRESWWVERDNLEDWPLFPQLMISGYVLSIGIIILGLIFLWIGFVLFS